LVSLEAASQRERLPHGSLEDLRWVQSVVVSAFSRHFYRDRQLRGKQFAAQRIVIAVDDLNLHNQKQKRTRPLIAQKPALPKNTRFVILDNVTFVEELLAQKSLCEPHKRHVFERTRRPQMARLLVLQDFPAQQWDDALRLGSGDM
jgi:hypothetical protein